MEIDNLPEVFPPFFFEATGQIPKKKKDKFTQDNLLPDFSGMNFSERFADVYMAWDDENLYFQFVVETPFQGSEYPEFLRTDAIELFVHTRADSLSRYLNKFSHHFLFFPIEVNGIKGMEITKFRGEDRHELCLPNMLSIESSIETKQYTLRVELPKVVLFGYDHSVSPSLRIDYRIHRYQNEPQYFFFDSKKISEHHLGLWPKIQLI
jgi:hypothetical protein